MDEVFGPHQHEFKTSLSLGQAAEPALMNYVRDGLTKCGCEVQDAIWVVGNRAEQRRGNDFTVTLTKVSGEYCRIAKKAQHGYVLKVSCKLREMKKKFYPDILIEKSHHEFRNGPIRRDLPPWSSRTDFQLLGYIWFGPAVPKSYEPVFHIYDWLKLLDVYKRLLATGKYKTRWAETTIDHKLAWATLNVEVPLHACHHAFLFGTPDPRLDGTLRPYTDRRIIAIRPW